jgi:Zn-dependent protease
MNSPLTTLHGNLFTRFMASGYGRLARLALGIALMAIGLTVVPRPAAFVIAALGVVPIAAGVFNLCPVAPLCGGHFLGSRYCAMKKPTGSDGATTAVAAAEQVR